MSVVVIVAGVLLAATVGICLYRVVRGPSALDRVIASDVLVATVICALGAEMAINGHTDTLPVVLGLSIFAFIGSVSIARFLSSGDDT